MCHVLIIEDDAIAAHDIRDTLQDEGATSFSFAETEQEAIDCARVRRPGIITSDVMLGRGSGPKAVQSILGELGALPVVFITATPEECVDCGAHNILEKPFSADRLAQVFRELAPL